MVTPRRCECPDTSSATSLSLYGLEERKAAQHRANECPGDYDVARYRRGDVELWLCSACYSFGDKRCHPGERRHQ